MEPVTPADIERIDDRLDFVGSELVEMKAELKLIKAEQAQRRESCLEHSIKTREHSMSIENLGRSVDRLDDVVKEFTSAVVALQVSMATLAERNKGAGKFVDNARDWIGKLLMAVLMLMLGYLLKGG